jgi:hypothetical protein
MSVLGTLPSVVEIDPPIPVNSDIIPHSRGVYIVNFDAVLTEDDQRKWLIESSADSLRRRDEAAWELERYGLRLSARLSLGICGGMNPQRAEERLAQLQKMRGVFISDYILAITRVGRGRRVAREVARMQQAMRERDWISLLAACWRLSGYEGSGAEQVWQNIKRIMVSIGATGDAALI